MDRNLPILLAEDDEDYALILQSAIKSLGWTNPIQIVHDGTEAINYLSGDGQYADREAYPFPSVMFIDVKMPGADGFDVLRWMRDHPECPVVPTIMLSSSDYEKDVRRAYELGVSAYATKPSDTNDLKAMLQAAYNFWAWCKKVKA